MKKANAVILSISVLCAVVALALITRNTFADNGGSGSGGSLGSSCSHYCTSWGAGWHYQDLGTFSSWSRDSSSTGAGPDKKAEALERCAETPGLYRLSLERSNNSGVSFVAGQFAGLVDVSRGVPYQSAIAENWDTVYAKFLIAEDHDVTYTAWEDTAYFCYDPDWEEECTEEECPPEPETGESNGYFWSTSKVEAVSSDDSDVPSGIEAKTEEDGEGEIKFSTDQSPVQIKFTHNMGYTNTTSFGENDEVDDAETKWTVYQAESSGSLGSAIEADKTFTAEDGESKDETKVKDTPLVTVSLNPGQTKTVCQTIKYDPKYISYTKTHHNATLTDPAYDEYTDPTGSGNGLSKVCATIHRPSDPDSGDGTGGTGSTNSDIMYAGEQAQISWNVSGNNAETRRLREWQAVVYRVPVNVSYSSSLHDGSHGPQNGNQPKSVCNWYGSWDYCNVLSGRSGSFGEEGQNHSYNEAANIVVPDTVGYKYCNSFGYRYEYWWYSSSTDEPWHLDKSYWRIHDASCRTIAKKPSIAIWNGGLMTAGGITDSITGDIAGSVITSSSPRFDNAAMGIEASGGGDTTLYGSWVEHLAVVGGNVKNFSSGASFAVGSKLVSSPSSSPLNTDNSPLTISNTNHLGSSGVLHNSAYSTRLQTFLETNQHLKNNGIITALSGDTLGAMTNISDTRILRRDGNLKITGNIETATGPYQSIYQIPQIVIFVHGNLEIASDVTQIDAWLVVDGEIDTCSNNIAGHPGFVYGETAADAIDIPSSACSKQLVFNGPVMAGSLKLNRSFGSDPLINYRTGTFGAASTKYAAGEVFNLSANTYLWGYAQAGRYGSSYTEGYSRELAPRY